MKRSLLIMAMLLSVAGCGPATPMTDSEFRGFCYQGGDNRFQSCDTISVCGDYSSVIDIKQASLGDCLKGCDSVYDDQRMRIGLGGCASAAGDARDWCERYCRTNYQK